MNKRERFQNFLDNKPVDRVPVGFWHHYCSFQDMDKGLVDEKIFEENVDGHRRSKAVFDPDIVKIMTDSLLTIPVDLTKAEKATDLRNLEPFSLDCAYVKKSIELTQRVRDMYADEDIPIFTTGFTPLFPIRRGLTTGGLLNRDESKFFRFLAEDPEAVACAMDILGQRIAEYHKLVVTTCGIDGVYLAVNNRCGAIDNAVYRQYIAPYEKAVLDDANTYAKATLLHICGYAGQTNDLSLYQDYNASAVNWSVSAEGVSLIEGKKFFGGKAVIGGFAQTGVLYKGTWQELQDATFALLEENGQTGIMLGADCTVPGDIDETRFDWIRQCAARFAKR